MLSLERHAGRLIELRLQPPLGMSELIALRDTMGALLVALGCKAVVCSDLRAVTLFPPELADQFLKGARTLNARIERSAFLLPERAVFTLQMERIIREAKSEARKSFLHAAELEAWLGETLEPDEQRRLRAFLSVFE